MLISLNIGLCILNHGLMFLVLKILYFPINKGRKIFLTLHLIMVDLL